jgi:hypothetical protein
LVVAGRSGDGPRRSLSTRRELLAASAIGAAALLTGCKLQPATTTIAVPGALSPADALALAPALDAEHRGLAAYTAAIPLLPAPAASIAKRILGHELNQTAALAEMIRRAGVHPAGLAPSYDLGRPRNAREVLQLLHGIERAQVAAYVQAIPKLTPGPARATVAAILAADAEHLALIRRSLGQNPAPQAFVTGTE